MNSERRQKSNRRGETPQHDQNSSHEADDHAEQPGRTPDNPLGQFVAARAVDEADGHGQRKHVPDRVAVLSQHQI